MCLLISKNLGNYDVHLYPHDKDNEDTGGDEKSDRHYDKDDNEETGRIGG